MQLSHRIGPGIREQGRRKFGRIYQRFGFARHSGSWRVPFDNLSRSRQALSGSAFSPVRMRNTMYRFFLAISSCRSLFPPVPSPRFTRHAERQKPVPRMCSALPCSDRSGRPRVSAAFSKSPQDQPSCDQVPETTGIEPRSHPIIGAAGLYRLDSGVGGICQQSQIALVLATYPYMGFAIHPHARIAGAWQRHHSLTNKPVLDDHRERLRSGKLTRERELSGRVVDHSSASRR